MAPRREEEDFNQHLYDPALYEPDYPSRQTANRVMALRLWASIFVRADEACAWCTVKLTKALTLQAEEPMPDTTATIDHLDGNDRNNKPENLVASCVQCNRTRALPAKSKNAGRRAFNAYLKSRGTDLQAAESRVRAQASTPINHGEMKFSPLHKRPIVSIWAPRSKANGKADRAANNFAKRVDKLLVKWRGDRIARIRTSGSARAKQSRIMRKFNDEQLAMPTDF